MQLKLNNFGYQTDMNILTTAGIVYCEGGNSSLGNVAEPLA
jgi:hypothetical protein